VSATIYSQKFTDKRDLASIAKEFIARTAEQMKFFGNYKIKFLMNII